MLRELLSEKSDLSVMRAMSLVAMLAAVVIAIVGLYSDKPLADVAILVSAFLVPAFGGKALQRRFEDTPAPTRRK